MGAFPQTSVLSTFTGADSAAVTGFSSMVGSAAMYYTNAASMNGADGVNSFVYYTSSTVVTPLDVTCVLAHSGANGTNLGILIAQSPGAAWNGYLVRHFTSTNIMAVGRITGGVRTNFGSDVTVSLAVGDSWGFRLRANGDFDAYTKAAAGAWTFKGTMGTDTTYTGTFYVGYNLINHWTGGLDGKALDDLSAGGSVEVVDASATLTLVRTFV